RIAIVRPSVETVSARADRNGIESLSRLQDGKGLVELQTGADELVGSRRVEGEHLVVTRDREPRVDAPCERCRFVSPEIPRDLTSGGRTVDRKQGDVDAESVELLGQPRKVDRVPRVIDRPGAAADDQSEKEMTAVAIGF